MVINARLALYTYNYAQLKQKLVLLTLLLAFPGKRQNTNWSIEATWKPICGKGVNFKYHIMFVASGMITAAWEANFHKLLQQYKVRLALVWIVFVWAAAVTLDSYLLISDFIAAILCWSHNWFMLRIQCLQTLSCFFLFYRPCGHINYNCVWILEICGNRYFFFKRCLHNSN